MYNMQEKETRLSAYCTNLHGQALHLEKDVVKYVQKNNMEIICVESYCYIMSHYTSINIR